MNLEELDYMIEHFRKIGDKETMKFYQSMRKSLIKIIKDKLEGKLYV
jgi:hypothetical protein|tara:strand:- start:137 stop:277 length:141 start_codon:yes stop_codon:yes gene_type:complete